MSTNAVFRDREQGKIKGTAFKCCVEEAHVRSIDISSMRDVDGDSHDASVTDVDVDGCEHRYLLCGSSDGALYIHDTANYSGIPRFCSKLVAKVPKTARHAHVGSVESVQWYPLDHGIFTTSGMDKKLKIWDANEMRPADEYAVEGRVYCHDMCGYPGGGGGAQLVALGTTINHVRLIDIRTGANTHELRGHSEAVIVVKWANYDANTLASGGADGRVYLWDVRQAKSCLRYLDYSCVRGRNRTPKPDGRSHDGYVNGLAFTTDGLCIVTYGKDGKLRMWDTLTGENLKARFPTSRNSRKNRVPFCTWHNFIFLPVDSAVYVLDTQDHSVVKVLKGHYNAVNCCTFNDTALELYSGGNDRNVLIWDSGTSRNTTFEAECESEPGERSQRHTIEVDTWSDDSD